jgi:hypothetical protein
MTASAGPSLAGGAIGAASLTLVHELLRRVFPNAPRVDALGMQALAKMGAGPDKLYGKALLGDLMSNAMFYSLAGMSNPRTAPVAGLALGALAGVGAVITPRHLPLDESTTNRTRTTQVLTVLLYTMGGLAAGLTIRALVSDGRESKAVAQPEADQTH